MGPKEIFALALLGIYLALTSVVADEDTVLAACSVHGSLVDGKCVCSAPLPVDDLPGWVGEDCAIPVHRLFPDGEDIKDTCEQGRVCNVVTPSEPVCFAMGIEDLATTAFHLNLLLSSDNVDAAVVLHGLLTNFTSTQDTGSGAAHLVPQAYPGADSVYSFAMQTTHGSPSAQLKLTRWQLGYGAYTGMYLCATSNATTSIGLRAAEHACPFSLMPNGTLRLCSGRATSDSCPHGTCSCPEGYAPPANWIVTPGLGFEDCSARLTELQPSSPLMLLVEPGSAASWAFFRLQLTPEMGHELRLWVSSPEASQGSLALYMRHQQLPSEAADQHELAAKAASWGREQSVQLTLRRSDPVFQPGTWYVGVYARGLGSSQNITVYAALYDCPNNCSGRGTCDAATATCTCSEAASPAAPHDCSIPLRELALGAAVEVSPRRWLGLEELVLRGVRDKLRQQGGGRLNLTAAFTTTDPDPPGLPAWVTGRPVIFAGPSLEAALNETARRADGGDGGWPPQPAGQVESLALAERGVSYSMEIGPWALGDDGSLHVLFWSPMGNPLLEVGYNLTVALRASCPADCSGHGTCDAASGACTCQPPYVGTDCSVDSSSLLCAPGTLHPIRREGVRGVCLAPCRDDGRSFDDASCDNLQCDGPGPGHGQLRRKGEEVECVEDACVAGNYTVKDASGDFLCNQLCVCPPDGGACAMEASCLPGTKQCLKGLRLAADGERCVAAPCEEGSLRRAYDLDGGAAFAVCMCAVAGDPASCGFTDPTQAAGNANGVVSCLPGFERQGSTSSARLSDGSSLVVGGRCGRLHRRGVSGGMVFFYCLLSIFLAAGLVVGGKYGVLWYEQYRYGRSVFNQGYVSWPLFGNRGNAGSAADDW